MRRFSLGRLMLLVAFLGANFAALRYLLAPDPTGDLLKQMLAGLLPLADALLLSAATLASRYRVAVRRRRDWRNFALYSTLLCGLSLGAAVAACYLATGPLVDYIETVGQPIDRRLRSLGVDTVSDTPLLRYVILPTFLGVLFSGPPLICSLILAFTLSQFELVVTPRAEDSCDASPSSP